MGTTAQGLFLTVQRRGKQAHLDIVVKLGNLVLELVKRDELVPAEAEWDQQGRGRKASAKSATHSTTSDIWSFLMP